MIVRTLPTRSQLRKRIENGEPVVFAGTPEAKRQAVAQIAGWAEFDYSVDDLGLVHILTRRTWPTTKL